MPFSSLVLTTLKQNNLYTKRVRVAVEAHLLSQGSPYNTYAYCFYVLNGPWDAAVPIICKDVLCAGGYAYNILRLRGQERMMWLNTHMKPKDISMDSDGVNL